MMWVVFGVVEYHHFKFVAKRVVVVDALLFYLCSKGKTKNVGVFGNIQ